MTFLDAYARFGPDSIAISEALDIKEHEADMLINEKMNGDYLRRENERLRAAGRQHSGHRGLVRFAGFDETERHGWWK